MSPRGLAVTLMVGSLLGCRSSDAAQEALLATQPRTVVIWPLERGAASPDADLDELQRELQRALEGRGYEVRELHAVADATLFVNVSAWTDRRDLGGARRVSVGLDGTLVAETGELLWSGRGRGVPAEDPAQRRGGFDDALAGWVLDRAEAGLGGGESRGRLLAEAARDAADDLAGGLPRAGPAGQKKSP